MPPSVQEDIAVKGRTANYVWESVFDDGPPRGERGIHTTSFITKAIRRLSKHRKSGRKDSSDIMAFLLLDGGASHRVSQDQRKGRASESRTKSVTSPPTRQEEARSKETAGAKDHLLADKMNHQPRTQGMGLRE